MIYLRRTLILCLTGFLLALTCLTSFAATEDENDSDREGNRAKLLSYVLRQQLTRHHFSHKPFDDTLSQAAFDLYLKQLDFQKRFLLKQDIEKLKPFATQIDDEINRGNIKLPVLTKEMLNNRIDQVRNITEAILKKGFDFSIRESFETDPEKLDWCANEKQLKERWRKILKYQVLTRMLILEDDEGEKSREELNKEATEKIENRFSHLFTRLQKDTIRDHYDRYFNAVTRAFDPHTTYFPPKQKEDFEIGMRGSLEGIGATLREEDGFIKVVRIIPGSAASRQGDLDAEDIILAVAQGAEEAVDVTDTRLRDAVELIRGPKGTEVRLTVRKPDGKRKVIAIVRDVVEIDETFVKSTTLPDETTGKTFGYIKIPSFYRDFQSPFNGGTGRNVTEDVEIALKRLNNSRIDGLVLDLRNNGGGALTDAVEITGLFIQKGPVVQVKTSEGKVKILADRDGDVTYDGPVVVLVNQFSASASEILAAALQDYGRGYILGSDHTYGKGTVQTILDLDRAIPFRNMGKYKPLGALKVTTQKFYRVNGGSTQERGVSSDLILPNRMQHVESGEKHMDNVLPWDTVEAADHVRWQEPLANLDLLRQKSSRRISSDEEFQKIVTDSDKAKERRDKTKVSLNLDVARDERLDDDEMLGDAPHGASDASDRREEGKKLNEEEKFQEWVKETREDPAVGEALRVLVDVHANPAAADKTADNK
ncbi:MAG: tail-specific protease [Desulfuromonas sp.]|nr:MAG: tail-specific protease [Desulfuromonas sp.]